MFCNVPHVTVGYKYYDGDVVRLCNVGYKFYDGDVIMLCNVTHCSQRHSIASMEENL